MPDPRILGQVSNLQSKVFIISKKISRVHVLFKPEVVGTFRIRIINPFELPSQWAQLARPAGQLAMIDDRIYEVM